MFGYINKNELLKNLKEEMDLQEKLRKMYNELASGQLELKLAARTEAEQKYYGCEHYKYTQWALEANWKWCEAATIYNMIKQM